MVLQLYPTEETVGYYYFVWEKMAKVYLILVSLFENYEWFKDLEAHSFRMCKQADGVYDMTAFMEIFWNGLAYNNFEVYMIVRPCFHLV